MGRGIVVNIARAKVKVASPLPGLSQTYYPTRFVYHDGTAAVWTENKKLKTATRVLYATNVEFDKPPTARKPMTVITGQSEWSITQNGGGCGCGSPLKKLSFTTLLDPDVWEVG